MKKILFLDDMEERHKGVKHLFKYDKVTYVYTYTNAIKALEEDSFQVLMLDHDLSTESIMQDPHTSTEENGTKLAQWIIDNKDPDDFEEIIIHSYNPAGAQLMKKLLKDAGFYAVTVPYSELLKLLQIRYTQLT